MKKIKGLACQTITWSNYKIAEIINDVSDLRFEGIEVPAELITSSNMNWNEVQSLAKHKNVQIIAVYQTARLGNRDYAVRKYELGKCKLLIEMLLSLGIKYLIIGDPPTDENDDCVVLAETLQKLGAFARMKNVKLCYHPHRGSIVESSDQVERLLSLTDPENLSLCLDTGHIYWGGGAPSEVIQRFFDRVAYIQFKDVRKRPLSFIEKVAEVTKIIGLNADRRKKFRDIGLTLLENKGPIITEIGRGDVDFLSVIKQLEKNYYDGWITLELDIPTVIPKLAMKRCLSHIRRLMQSIEKNE